MDISVVCIGDETSQGSSTCSRWIVLPFSFCSTASLVSLRCPKRMETT